MGTMTWATVCIFLILQVNWTLCQNRIPPWVTVQTTPLPGPTYLHLASGKAVPYPVCYTIRNNAVNNIPYLVDLGNGNTVKFPCSDILRLGIPCNIVLDDYTISSDLFTEVLKCQPQDLIVELSNGLLLSYELFCSQVNSDHRRLAVPDLPILPDIDFDSLTSGDVFPTKPTPSLIVPKFIPPAPVEPSEVGFLPPYEAAPITSPYPEQSYPQQPYSQQPYPIQPSTQPRPPPSALPCPPPCPEPCLPSLPQPCVTPPGAKPYTHTQKPCPAPEPCPSKPCLISPNSCTSTVPCSPSPCLPEPCPLPAPRPCFPRPSLPEQCPEIFSWEQTPCQPGPCPQPCLPQPCTPTVPCPPSYPVEPCPPCLPKPCSPVTTCHPEPCPFTMPVPCPPEPCCPKPCSSDCNYLATQCLSEPHPLLTSFPRHHEICPLKSCSCVQTYSAPCEPEHILLWDHFVHPPVSCVPAPAFDPCKTNCGSTLPHSCPFSSSYSNLHRPFYPSACYCPFEELRYPNGIYA